MQSSAARHDPLYMDSPQRQKLIDRLVEREAPAVEYPASEVNSDVVRADTESVPAKRRSIGPHVLGGQQPVLDAQASQLRSGCF